MLQQYLNKTLDVLNKSLKWNYEKLPDNTFDLQLAKYYEEINEVLEALTMDYQHFVEESADVLISIGGMMRFDGELARKMLDVFIEEFDKHLYMDVVDFAEQKIKILYERDYSHDQYHHV